MEAVIVLAVIIGLTTLLYVPTIVFWAIYDLCPFVTRISRYLRILVHRYWATPKDRKTDSDTSTVGVLQALLWLFENARDQASQDGAVGALAGFSQRKLGDTSHNSKHEQARRPTLVNQPTILQAFTRLWRVLEGVLKDNSVESGALKWAQHRRYATSLLDMLALPSLGLPNANRGDITADHIFVDLRGLVS
jgi:hypothetical protein